ncbi:sigma-E processing peptidase SpoIIGA [Clostridium polynesiense]|uniref:sigma-E processing peptidase SpoIIGA n=1 Tax=Clostridium polynesiense TaxID=1325933 RepID=UPI000694E472|nr:sigma-E processing peptidase SpoIIGA [Clostridium polynesiense]
MKIYIDVLLIENYLVSMFIMVITAKVLQINKKYLYIHTASFISALYTLTLIIPSLSFLSQLPFKLLFPYIIVSIAYRKKDFIFNVKASSIYLLVSFLLAGFCFFMENSFNTISNKYSIENYSYKKLLLSIIIFYLIMDRLFCFIKDRAEIQNYVYKLEVFHKGTRKSFNAFLDTGNELREPATNLPVIIVEKEILREFYLLENKKYMISYKLVDGSVGILKGFIPEEITLINKGERKLLMRLYAFLLKS